MAKSKSGQKKDLKNVKKQLHTIKNGSIKKDKNPKFKNTLIGRVGLINNSKTQNKNVQSQKNEDVVKNQNLSKNNTKQSKQNKQNLPIKTQNKPANKKINLISKKKLEEIDDSNSDIDVTLEDTSLSKVDKSFESEEESDVDIPDIFDKSLQDESDEDDEDFEEEEEDDDDEEDDNDNDDDDDDDEREENNRNKKDKNLAAYKTLYECTGRRLKQKENEKKLHHDDDDDIDEDESEESDTQHRIHTLVKGFENKSNNDQDFEEEVDSSDTDTDYDDDNDDDDNDGRKIVEHKGITMFKGVKSKIENSTEDDSDEGETEDEDEDEDKDGDEDSVLGLEALLGNSIPDEDDDEDFNEEDEDEDDEDDDISDEDEDGKENDNVIKIIKEKDITVPNSKPIHKEQKQVKKEEKQEDIDKRTLKIFIDNTSKEIKEEDVKKLFSVFGPINNIHCRDIIPRDSKMSKKIAARTKQIHPKVTAYILAYINYESQESAQKALTLNGRLFRGNYIQIHIVGKSMKKEWDGKKAIFIGNLSYNTDNTTLWKHFSRCGEIESVHLIRDKETGQCKGFGYINFKNEDSVMLALKLDGTEIMKRAIRVKPYTKGDNKKGTKRDCPNNNDDNPQKKSKNNLGETVAHKIKNETKIKKQKKLQKNDVKSQEERSILFQGQKADSSKNKKGKNKLDKKKKKMAKKLTTKSNISVKV